MAGTGQDAQPNLPNIYTDPSQVATPGLNQEVQNVYNQGAQAQGQGNNATLAALQKAGVAHGSEAGNALGNVAQQTAAGESGALAGLQNQQFQEQSSLMNALNQVNLANYANQSQNNLYNNAQEQGNAAGWAGLGSQIFGPTAAKAGTALASLL